jgi:hypothetical protein
MAGGRQGALVTVRRLIAAGAAVAALVGWTGVLHPAPASASVAQCIDYLHDQGFVPGQVNPSSYSIAETACDAGSRGGWIICTSLMGLAVEDFNEAHPPGVDTWRACQLASWVGW